MKKLFEEVDVDANINRVNTTDLRYAHDSVLLASSAEELQVLIASVTGEGEEYMLCDTENVMESSILLCRPKYLERWNLSDEEHYGFITFVNGSIIFRRHYSELQ